MTVRAPSEARAVGAAGYGARGAGTMTGSDAGALWLSLRLAAVTTALLLPLCTPLAWWLASGRARWRAIVDAVVSIPLVLPPTVLGFYLLVLLGPRGGIGRALQALGLQAPVFSFGGLVIGSMLYSLPFVVQPLRDAFESVGPRVLEAAATLRASPSDRFLSVTVPLASRGFVTGAVLAFAHTLGEFGVVLMIGGNIPGRTRTASIAIFDHAEALEYGAANRLSATLIAIAVVLLVGLYTLTRSRRRPAALLRAWPWR
jgi:molybdate transport system permease protein